MDYYKFRLIRYSLTNQINAIRSKLLSHEKQKEKKLTAADIKELTDREKSLVSARKKIVGEYEQAKLNIILLQASKTASEVEKVNMKGMIENMTKSIKSIDDFTALPKRRKKKK